MAPTFFDLLEGDVGGHAGGEGADGGVDLVGVGEVGACEVECSEQGVDLDPAGIAIIIGECEFVFFARHGKALDELGAAVDAGEATAAVLEAAGDDLEGEICAAGEMVAEECGIDIHADGIDIMKDESLELGSLFEQRGEGAVAEEVRNLIPMADWMEALEWEVVGVVGSFAGCFCPVEEGGAEGFTDFLLLHVEDLLGHFFPGEAEVTNGGDGAQADGFPLRKVEWARVMVVLIMAEEAGGGVVGEVAGGEDVG